MTQAYKASEAKMASRLKKPQPHYKSANETNENQNNTETLQVSGIMRIESNHTLLFSGCF